MSCGTWLVRATGSRRRTGHSRWITTAPNETGRLWQWTVRYYVLYNAKPAWLLYSWKVAIPYREAYPMKTIIQMSEAEEAKALPLLLRHSPGTVLPNRIYVVSEEAAKRLREAGV